MQSHNFRSSVALVLLTAVLIATTPTPGVADTIEELRKKIDEKGNLIKELDKEIEKYNSQLKETNAQARTLQSAVQELDQSRAKLGKDIQLTTGKIDYTTLTIASLEKLIEENEQKIHRSRHAVSRSIAIMNENDDISLIEALLINDNLSDFWSDYDSLQQIQINLRDNYQELASAKEALEINKQKTEEERSSLVSFKYELEDQKTIVELNKREKDKLLSETKQLESEYQRRLAEAKALKDAFQKELYAIESQLKLQIDPNSFPTAGTKVLSWPVSNVVITQQFGDTAFSRQTSVYNGNGHNGIDLGVPTGTPVMAALSGVVEGFGDTDTVCPNASFGKWILIKHPNGLSTMYAHLSLIKVTKGQQVSTGDVIGYSGNTGYSTGPHLHFTVYASQGVQIMSRQSMACQGVYTMPIADLKAYLNPILYL